MKTVRIIVMILSLSVIYQLAAAQTACSGNKFRMVKGSYRCGCHCQKKCVATSDTAAYRANYWYFGTDCFGSCCWVRPEGMESSSLDNVPGESSLSEIYPNPTYGSVTISFSLAEAGEVSLDVFDMMSRHVATIDKDVFEDGYNEVIWNTDVLSQGIYFIQMRAGSYGAIKRISVIK
jgi:hypothetical protein